MTLTAWHWALSSCTFSPSLSFLVSLSPSLWWCPWDAVEQVEQAGGGMVVLVVVAVAGADRWGRGRPLGRRCHRRAGRAGAGASPGALGAAGTEACRASVLCPSFSLLPPGAYWGRLCVCRAERDKGRGQLVKFTLDIILVFW